MFTLCSRFTALSSSGVDKAEHVLSALSSVLDEEMVKDHFPTVITYLGLLLPQNPYFKMIVIYVLFI